MNKVDNVLEDILFHYGQIELAMKQLRIGDFGLWNDISELSISIYEGVEEGINSVNSLKKILTKM